MGTLQSCPHLPTIISDVEQIRTSLTVRQMCLTIICSQRTKTVYLAFKVFEGALKHARRDL